MIICLRARFGVPTEEEELVRVHNRANILLSMHGQSL